MKPLVKCGCKLLQAPELSESVRRQARLLEEATFSTDSGDAGLSEEANASQLLISSQKQTWRSERDQIPALLQVKPN